MTFEIFLLIVFKTFEKRNVKTHKTRCFVSIKNFYHQYVTFGNL